MMVCVAVNLVNLANSGIYLNLIRVYLACLGAYLTGFIFYLVYFEVYLTFGTIYFCREQLITLKTDGEIRSGTNNSI